MTVEEFKTKLKENPKQIEFSETIEVIEAYYDFSPTAFVTFSKIESLAKEETLACFGAFYYDEVINDPTGAGHQNIRNFMKSGFDRLTIHGAALTKKRA